MKIVLICLVTVAALATVLFWYQARKARLYPSCPNQDVSCDLSQAPYRDPTLPMETRVEDLLGRMTLQEKIGQMALVEKNSVHDTQDITRYGLGALLSGGGAKPDPNTPAGWHAMVKDFESYSRKTRLQIPLLYGVDAVHGHAGVPGATVFPHQIGLAATGDKELVKKVYRAVGEELAATGIYWNFSPSLDIPADPRWGRVYETFGQHPETVEMLGQAAIEGLQQASASSTIAVLATAKHYIGTGAMAWGTSSNKNFTIDQGATQLTDQELRRVHLPAFQKAIEGGVMSVMAGLNSWQGKKLSANKYLVTDVLKKELGFTGFVVSDWYAVYEIPGNTYEATVTGVNAGIDMVMLPYDYKHFTDNLERAVRKGDISEERINDAVARILRAKFSLGLFDRPNPHELDMSVVGSAEHRELAREAVRKSAVLLKNTAAVLPISKHSSSLVVAGTAADNVGQQSGGWTVEWQGIDGNWLPGATSILAGIRAGLPPGANVIYNEQAVFAPGTKAPVGIAIVGEKSYAEGWGDVQLLTLSSEDLEIIRKVEAASEKIVVIIVSGRPLDIEDEAKEWDAVIAAWLPGSEGAGVADVLFGDYPFTGRLPVAWGL